MAVEGGGAVLIGTMSLNTFFKASLINNIELALIVHNTFFMNIKTAIILGCPSYARASTLFIGSRPRPRSEESQSTTNSETAQQQHNVDGYLETGAS